MISTYEIADACLTVLRERAEELDAEQAVRGLDALLETELHPFLADALAPLGATVLREQVYPAADLGEPGKRPRRNSRQRCDLVLLEEGDELRIADEIQELSERDRSLGTLFEAQSQSEPLAPQGTPPELALWIEVKSCAQFGYEGGPRRGYASDMLAPLDDAAKLAEDGRIEEGLILLIQFGADEELTRRDARAMLEEGMSRALPLSDEELVGAPITDRVGNAWMQVACARVRTPGLSGPML